MSAVAIRNLIAAVLLGALAYFAYGWAYDIGAADADLVWQKKYNKDLIAANKSLDKALADFQEEQETRQALSQAIQESFAYLSASFQEKLGHVESRKNSVIADLRSDNLKLRIGIKTAGRASACSSNQPEAGEATAAASGHHGTETAELSNEAAEFLIGLASEADKVVEQLTACQGLLIAERSKPA